MYLPILGKLSIRKWKEDEQMKLEMSILHARL